MHPTRVKINLEAIKHNFLYLKNKQNKKVISVIKADGYGHGAIEIAKRLEKHTDYFAVAFLKEAVELRQAGITSPILVLSVTKVEDLPLAEELSLTLSCFDHEWFEQIKEMNYKIKFHIKVDTGMNRLGFKNLDQIREVKETIESHSTFELEGIYTHYATADCDEEEYFKARDKFKDIIDTLDINLPYIHTSNSPASLKYFEEHTTAIRPGLALYGLNPFEDEDYDLEPAFELYTKVGLVKDLKAGESVSYGYTYTAETDQKIAILPVGSADGWLRYHSGRKVWINNKFYQIIGRVCMDHTILIVDDDVKQFDNVELIGPHITVDEVAKDLDTINYEIVCTISKRVKRYY
jgi:alanine racemase